VMLIAVACTVDSRFSAVTTISSSELLLSPGVVVGVAAHVDPPRAVAHHSAATSDARNSARAPGAHISRFMFYLPDKQKNGCAMLNAGIPWRLVGHPRTVYGFNS
jgi:hypothetical protein